MADRYLARTGYDGQQTDESVSPNRPDNLFEPVPGDYAAGGVFTSEAKAFSLQSWADENRKALALTAGLMGVGAWLWRKNR